ncbi:hypothetical protein A0H81_05355 [Grifola frondosa]|uniref:Uncharacterized protein n=1 Tax=Grifola frondosa TaxID=5627 RepID=A0A1C7MCD3_GRIFR|nr:hypothetical protein A0H81_05355 [Grifola frondosa]
MVFGYAFLADELVAFGQRHGYGDDSNFQDQHYVTSSMITKQLPRGKRRFATVLHLERKCLASCFVVGSNLKPETLEMARDWDLIKRMQEVFETKELPRWFVVYKC